jgi:serine/threonine protein kinase
MLPSLAQDLVDLGLRIPEDVEQTLDGVDVGDERALLERLELSASEHAALADHRSRDRRALAREARALALRRWARSENLSRPLLQEALEANDPLAALEAGGHDPARLPDASLTSDQCRECGLRVEIARGLRRQIPYCVACGKVRLFDATNREDTLLPERSAVDEELPSSTREDTFNEEHALDLGEDTSEPLAEFREDTLRPERPRALEEHAAQLLDEQTLSPERTPPTGRGELSEDTLSPERPAHQPELSEDTLSPERPAPQPELSEDTLSPERPAHQPELSEDTLSPERPAPQPEDQEATQHPGRSGVVFGDSEVVSLDDEGTMLHDPSGPQPRPESAAPLPAEETRLSGEPEPVADDERTYVAPVAKAPVADEVTWGFGGPEEELDDERTLLPAGGSETPPATENRPLDDERTFMGEAEPQDPREITWGFGERPEDPPSALDAGESLDDERTFLAETPKLEREVTWGFGGEGEDLSEDTLLPGGDTEAPTIPAALSEETLLPVGDAGAQPPANLSQEELSERTLWSEGDGANLSATAPGGQLEETHGGEGLSEDTLWPEDLGAEPTPPTQVRDPVPLPEGPKPTKPGFDAVPESTLWEAGETTAELEESTSFSTVEELGGATFWSPASKGGAAALSQSGEATAFAPGGATATSEEQLQVANSVFLAWAQEQGLDDAKLLVARKAQFPVQQVLEKGWLDPALIRPVLEGGHRVACGDCKVEYQLGHGVAPYALAVPCARCGGKLGGETDEATVVVKGASSPKPAPKRVARLGPYKLIKELGRGGMGAVYEAEDEDGTPVALKVLKASLGKNSNHRRRFEREGRALERFSHPHVVQLKGRGFDKESKRAYLAIELVRGMDLNDLIKQRRRLSAGETIYIMCTVASALDAAHQQNLLHRDIKPGNVLLTPQGDVKVTDFGIALEEDVSLRLTAQGAVLGTPQYIAPEAISDSEWGPPVDVYALGCMGFKTAAGRLPFVHRTVLELLDAHKEETPPRLETVAEDVPQVLADLIDRMLAKDPAARPTCAEIQDVLEEHCPGQDDVAGLWGDPEDATVVLPNELRGSAAQPAVSSSNVSGTSETLSTGQVFHQYLLKDELGRGGMGVVYRARHLRLKKEVAVKVMLAGALAGDAERRRFLREAEAAAALQHPYVVGVLDSGEWNGNLYLAMDHVNGKPLQDYYRDHPEREPLLQMFMKVCEGVHHAHSRGVIHRDLKPDNVLIDTEGDPHVLDFGIAKRIDAPEEEVEATLANLTTDGDIMGTLRYMPPEQAAGRANEVDVRSDVYTLGGILYELTTLGGAPFKGNVGQMIHKIVHEEPTPPSKLTEGVPWELDAICLKALSKSADQRYQSARELAADVERYLTGVPIVAQRANAIYRFRKWSRRNRGKIAATLAVVAILLSVIGAWAADRVQTERQRQADLFADALAGWTQAQAGKFRDARETFGVAQSRLAAGEALPVPAEVKGLVPPRLAAGHLDETVLERWKAYATERLGVEDALLQVAAGRKALAAKDYPAVERALSAAEGLARDESAVRALRSEFGLALFESGRVRFEASAAVAGLDERQAALEAAGKVLERARDLGEGRAADTLRTLDRSLIELERERGLASARKVADKHITKARALSAEAETRLEGLKALSDEERQAARSAGQSRLRAADRELTLALGALPRLALAEELKTRIHLRLAELALGAEEISLAELALEDARLYGRLSSEVAAVASRVAAVDMAGRAFRDQVARGDAAFEKGDYEAAQRAYGLALAQRNDPDVDRRRQLSEAQSRAARARAAKQLRKEREALLLVRSLDPRDADAATRLDELRQALFSEALEAAQRTLADAVQQGDGFDRAIKSYEDALAIEPRDRGALRGRAEAYALRDRPPERVLVSVGLEQITTGVARSDEVLRFYIDRTEVKREAFAKFVSDGGYQKKRYWSAAGWAARERYRDRTGRRAPAGWVDAAPPPGTEALPVTGVSYFEAEAYARWRGVRLPSDREWRLAACFDPTLGRFRRNPWADGSKVRPAEHLRAVAQDPRDESPFGAMDMGLNASEWVRPEGEPSGPSARAWVRGLSIRAFPYDLEQGVDAWRKQPRATFRDVSVGFRCVEDVSKAPAYVPGGNR